MWFLRPWFSGGLGSAESMAELGDLQGPFQLKWFCHSTSLASHLECLFGHCLPREGVARRTLRSPYVISCTSQASTFHWPTAIWRWCAETRAVKCLSVQGQLHSWKPRPLLDKLLIIWLANGLINHLCCEVCHFQVVCQSMPPTCSLSLPGRESPAGLESFLLSTDK